MAEALQWADGASARAVRSQEDGDRPVAAEGAEGLQREDGGKRAAEAAWEEAPQWAGEDKPAAEAAWEEDRQWAGGGSETVVQPQEAAGSQAGEDKTRENHPNHQTNSETCPSCRTRTPDSCDLKPFQSFGSLSRVLQKRKGLLLAGMRF